MSQAFGQTNAQEYRHGFRFVGVMVNGKTQIRKGNAHAQAFHKGGRVQQSAIHGNCRCVKSFQGRVDELHTNPVFKVVSQGVRQCGAQCHFGGGKGAAGVFPKNVRLLERSVIKVNQMNSHASQPGNRHAKYRHAPLKIQQMVHVSSTPHLAFQPVNSGRIVKEIVHIPAERHQVTGQC